MNPVTHGLASYALKRGFFPRSSRSVTFAMLAAGTFADLDWLSYSYGPEAFLRWHRTCLHSLLAAVVISLLIAACVYLTRRTKADFAFSVSSFAGPLCAALLHVLMDACQPAGARLFWPLRTSQVALDWIPGRDPWIFALLLAAIVMPELFLLVGREIGARTKRPRGRTGALVGLVLLLVYGGARAILHVNAVALLRTATYENEVPRRLAAYPDSVSVLTWHGIVDTTSAIHILNVSLAPGAFFNPQGASNIHKPEPSPILDAAQKTEIAQKFLNFAQFPKATVERETTENHTTGYSVELQDLRFTAMGKTLGAIQADINLDPKGVVTLAQLEWEKEPQR